jgi:hypothetical protein
METLAAGVAAVMHLQLSLGHGRMEHRMHLEPV